jgi:hypothetical protein
MVKPAPASTFIADQAEFLLHLLVDALDDPAMLRHSRQIRRVDSQYLVGSVSVKRFLRLRHDSDSASSKLLSPNEGSVYDLVSSSYAVGRFEGKARA